MRRLLLVLLAPAALAAQPPERLFQERRFDEARVAYAARLAKDRNDANALYWMGRIASAQDKSAEAMEWFEKAIKLDDTNALYHVWYGNAIGDEAGRASKLRQPFLAKRVKAEFERAVQLDPSLVDAREGLVGFYSQAPGFMGGSMDKAREQAAEIGKLSPMRGQLNLARIAQRQKDAAAEERAYQAAITIAPDSAQPYYSLAAFFRRASRWDDAFVTYERLMKARPDDALPHLGWGAVSALSGKSLDRGERELKHFLTNAGPGMAVQNVSGAHFRLGQIYEKTGRRELAKAAYVEAVRVNPQNAEAKRALEVLK